jgi:integrase
MKNNTSISMFDTCGNRKYLTTLERNAFLEAASEADPEVMTFCIILAYTGARLSEVLALSPMRIDFSTSIIVFESLKKRQRGLFRAVPVPFDVLLALDQVHDIRMAQQRKSGHDVRIWSWCRTTAWSRVKVVMAAAGIFGIQASPKGLRHCLGVSAIQSGVPLNLVQRWLGHAQLSTTAIYANATGPEELSIAGRFWAGF